MSGGWRRWAGVASAVGACSCVLAAAACSSGNSNGSPDGGGETDASRTDATSDVGTTDGTGGGQDGPDTSTDASDASVADATACPSGLTDSGIDPGGCVYDLALQFNGSVNGGPNPWSYGKTATPGGPFVPFAIQGGPDAGTDSGAAVPALYSYSSLDPTVTVSGGDLVGWNGSDDNPNHPAGTAFYPFLLENVGTTSFVLSSNSGGVEWDHRSAWSDLLQPVVLEHRRRAVHRPCEFRRPHDSRPIRSAPGVERHVLSDGVRRRQRGHALLGRLVRKRREHILHLATHESRGRRYGGLLGPARARFQWRLHGDLGANRAVGRGCRYPVRWLCC